MPIAYATVEDCVDIVPSLGESSEDSSRLEAALFQSLLDASRLIETDLFVPVDYFRKGDEEFSTKQFSFQHGWKLWIYPFIQLEWIKDVDGDLFDADDYRLPIVEDVNHPRQYFIRWRWLRQSCGSRPVWQWNFPVTISAKWGFPCIPPDITLAVKNMGCLMFLNNPTARIGLNETSFDSNQEQRLRQTYNRVLDAWSNKMHHRNIGIG